MCHSPLFVSDYYSKYLICWPIISGYPKHIFVSEKKFLDTPKDLIDKAWFEKKIQKEQKYVLGILKL